MDNIVKLFNPNDQPFGKLSNNAYHPMIINGKKYGTVTNYILSNMLISPLLRQIVQNTPIKGTTGVNKELINAIDYLININQPVQTISRDQMISVMSDTFDQPPEYFANWDDDKIKNTYYRRVKGFTKNKKELTGKDSTTKKQIQGAWVDYAKTGAFKDQEKELQKRQEYIKLISNQVKKPFDSIDLPQLKQQIIQQAEMNQMGIYKLYTDSVNKELFNTIKNATDKGFQARFENSDLANILLSTDNLPIQYESGDPFLGMGTDGKGHNIVGKVLMQLRFNLRIKHGEEERLKEDERKNKHIYNTYLAYTILREEIFHNNNDLKQYLGLNPEQIIQMYGLSNFKKGIPTQEIIIDMYNMKDGKKLDDIIYKEIYHPGTLVINMRKIGLRQLQNLLLQRKKDIIFDSYLEYIISRKYGDKIDSEVDRMYDIQDKLLKEGIEHDLIHRKKIKKAIKQEINVNPDLLTESEYNKLLKKAAKNRNIFMERGKLSRKDIYNIVIQESLESAKKSMDSNKLEKIKARVIDLFNLGMLSASLSDKIDSDVDKLNIPSDEDIEEAEIAELPVPVPVIEEKAENSSELSASSMSSENSLTKGIKTIFQSDNKTDLINQIIKIQKHGSPKDFDQMSKKELKQVLHTLEQEQIKQTGTEYLFPTDTSVGIYKKPTGETIYIFENDEKNIPEIRPLNPIFYTGMIQIDSKNYPTIQHYIIARLIAMTGINKTIDSDGATIFNKGMGILEAYKMIMIDPTLDGNIPQDFLNIELAAKVYDDSEKDSNKILLSFFTVTSLGKKFEDKDLQNLLLLTGNREIQWTGPFSTFLGIGTKENPGENYVGVTMMDIREKIKETRALEEEITIDINDLNNFIQKDSFITDWITMRLKDMCGIVFKLQEYLKQKGYSYDLQYENDLLKLVHATQDKIYQPCTSLINIANDINIPVPEFVINIVKKCSGMSSGFQPVKYYDPITKSVRYNKEIEEKIAEYDRMIGNLDSEFWNETRTEHPLSESKYFNNKQRGDLVRFMRYIDGFTSFYLEMVEMVKNANPDNQYIFRDIQESWNALTKNEKDEYQKRANVSVQQKHEQLEKFKANQQEEYNEFWGIKKGVKTKDEISRHEHQLNEIRKELSSYIREKEKKDLNYTKLIKEISQIYWNRIAVMLTVLIQHLNPSTSANIRDAIVKVEMLNSSTVNCVKIIQNEKDNCIVSAIINLLIGISEVKEAIDIDPTLESDDIELAGSIIMNTKFKQHKIIVEEEKPDEEEDEKDFDVGNEGYFPEDEKTNEGGDEYEENPYFSFNGRKNIGGKGGKQLASSGDLNKVEQQIILIGHNTNNSKDIAIDVLKMVETIKEHRMSQKVKQNRINFFATIR